jgi:hypothetical protein
MNLNKQQRRSPKQTMTQIHPTMRSSWRLIFIALDRHARGEAPDPLKDWLEAERQLTRAV